ncbi:MAG TPA: YtxH domain-containing protein [Candidatus Sulfotelmatobacter sp.]|jgi:gas vesicle protein|nr:YtxH domain-containing protein [Candidatus Sulfotelmatobacter sp.]
MSDRDGSSFVWFLAGLGLGALAGVLYAPRSGSETREVLRARAEEGRDYMRSRAREVKEQVKDQASQWADKGRDVVNTQKEQFRAAYEAGRQAYHEATSETGTTK